MAQAIALTIAGSDSGGGAGIQADLKSFSALGVYGASVLTAITAQNTQRVSRVEGVSPAMILAQMDAVFDDLDIGAIKIGMLGGPDVITTVAGRLRSYLNQRAVPVVIDPVMIAKSGDVLLPQPAIAAMIAELLPMATVLTPNLPEAAVLLNNQEAATIEQMRQQGHALLALGPSHILIKGGHAEGPVCTDLLIGPESLDLSAPRVITKNTHGTGCSLSSAITAGLAKGLTVPAALRQAHSWLQGAIRSADRLCVGSGHGPVHHFHAQWIPA